MTVVVELTRRAEAQRKALRGRVLATYEKWLDQVQHQGCRAMDYRLTGDTVDRFCVRHLSADWRVVVVFPDPRRAVIVLIGQHIARSPRLDIYHQLYGLSGITTPPAEQRRKPPCCTETQPAPMWSDAEVIDLVRRARLVADNGRRR